MSYNNNNTMEETITLNQLIKRLFVYRAEHPETGKMKIYAGSLSLTGEVEKKDEFLALK